MNVRDLVVGKSYRLNNGRICRILEIWGRGRSHQVFLTRCPEPGRAYLRMRTCEFVKLIDKEVEYK